MITGQLVNADKVVTDLRARAPALEVKMREKIKRLTLETERLAKQLVPHKSGRLQRSINSEFTQESEHRFTGTVGTNVVYARVQEYGGPVTVRAHMRMMTEAWGRPVKNPRLINVREHIANYPEQSFLRAALNMMSDIIAQDLGKL